MTDGLILGAFGLVVSLIAIVTPIIRLNTKITELTVMVAELEKKVDKHNNVVERTYKLESDLKTAFNRIDELRDDIREGGKA